MTTFDLKSPEAAAWDYFVDGERQRAAAVSLRHRAVQADSRSAETLDPTKIWAYHAPRRKYPYPQLPLHLVDYYRCWTEASVTDEFVADIRENGIRQPLVIYTNGTHGLLGEGNHRLAAARTLGIRQIPVVIVPDRMVLPDGMDDHDTVPIDPEVDQLLGQLIRSHFSGSTAEHRVKTFTEDHTVWVFCLCGAQWKRPKE